MARRPPADPSDFDPVIRVRRIHRRDLNRVWDFLKKVFRVVNKQTVEYQRPRTKTRFLEIYEEEGIEQLLFEVHQGTARQVVGYAECAYEVIGSDNWINERYFDNRDMRPLFVEEIAIHPGFQGRGIGSFVIEQLEHLARVHGCTHLVLEVAANNKRALQFYRARSFAQLDAAIFLAKKVISEPELLPPRPLRPAAGDDLALDPAPEVEDSAAEAVELLAPELAAEDEEDVPEDMPETPRRTRAKPRRRTGAARAENTPDKRRAPAPEDSSKKRKSGAAAEPRKPEARPGKPRGAPAPGVKPREPRARTGAQPVPEDTPREPRVQPAPKDTPELPSRKRRGEPAEPTASPRRSAKPKTSRRASAPAGARKSSR